VSCAKMAEPIKMQFGMVSGVDPVHGNADALMGMSLFGCLVS